MPSSKEYLTPELRKVQPRPRLYNYIEERKVVIIEAGPGMGKTAAVYDYLTNEDKKSLWFNIKKTDSSYNNLLEHLKKTFGSIMELPGNGQSASAEPATPAQSADEFCDLVIEKLPADLFLVLEDFEFINRSPQSCTVIERILVNLSKKIHIALLTREAPNVSLARIRSRKELTELKSKDLAFTREDLHSLIFSLYDMSFDSLVIDRLLEISEGWITSIIFLLEKICCLNRIEAEHLLDNFLENPSIPEIDDYFKTQVLEHLSTEFRKSVIMSGSVNLFTPHLIEILTEDSGFKFIKELQRLNLFISLKDASAYQYSFNPVFRTYLHNEFLKFDEEEKNVCYNKISKYYNDEDDVIKTVEYLSKAGSFEDAVYYLTKNSGDLIKNTSFDALNTILSFFPEEMHENDPYLSYLKAVVNNLLQPVASRKKLIDLLEVFNEKKEYTLSASIYNILLTNYFFFQTNTKTIEDIIENAESFLSKNSSKIPKEPTELLNALIPLGKWWTGLSREKAFETALRAEETSGRLHNEEAFLYSRLVLARIYIAKGEFDSARILLTRTDNFFSERSLHLYGHYKNISRLYLGDAYFFSGQISSALKQINSALSDSGSSPAFRPYLELKIILYSLYLENIEKAEALHDKARNRDNGENPYLKYYYEFLFEMLIAYRSGNRQRSKYYCGRLLESDDPELIQSDKPYAYLAISEVILFTEGADIAFARIENLKKLISSDEYPYSYASIVALLGYIQFLNGKAESASEYFTEMENIVRDNDYVNLDICSPDLLAEIAECSKSDVFNEFPRLKNSFNPQKDSSNEYILSINTLGSLKVFVKGREIPDNLLGGQKRVIDLLKLLLVYRKSGVTKDRVYELFWPRYSYKSARDNLNTIIYRFRKLIGLKEEFLHTDMVSIKFKENAVITDADKFIDLIRLGDEAEKEDNYELSFKYYNSAVELYKGDFLENDLNFDFISDERDSLRFKYRGLLFKMIQLSMNAGEFREALELTKLLIDKDPLCEPAYRLLMVSSAAVGNRSEIPRIFEKLNKKLQAYYKITADDRTLKLRDRLLGAEPPVESMWSDETII